MGEVPRGRGLFWCAEGRGVRDGTQAKKFLEKNRKDKEAGEEREGDNDEDADRHDGDGDMDGDGDGADKGDGHRGLTGMRVLGRRSPGWRMKGWRWTGRWLPRAKGV